MSENDDGVKEVVEKSKTVSILIERKPNGEMEMSGPINDPLTMLGMLELAKGMVHEILRKNREKRAPNIVIPTIGPKRPM